MEQSLFPVFALLYPQVFAGKIIPNGNGGYFTDATQVFSDHNGGFFFSYEDENGKSCSVTILSDGRDGWYRKDTHIYPDGLGGYIVSEPSGGQQPFTDFFFDNMSSWGDQGHPGMVERLEDGSYIVNCRS